MQITPLTPEFGARIEGVRLGHLSDGELEQVVQAWHARRGLLAFPGQHLTDDELLAFSRRLGELDPPPNQENGRQSPPGYPDVYVVSNIKDTAGKPIGALGDGEAVWHTDMSYLPVPPLASMLMALEIPSSGGNTWFCDMTGIYRDLPAPLQERLLGAQVKHDGTYNSGGYVRAGVQVTDDPFNAPGRLHPAVVLIPETRLPALYLGRRRMAYITGCEPAESAGLLDEIWRYVDAPARNYQHAWSLGDLVLWDNRTTMHRRDAFPADQRRLMHRTQIKGRTAPVAYQTSLAAETA